MELDPRRLPANGGSDDSDDGPGGLVPAANAHGNAHGHGHTGMTVSSSNSPRNAILRAAATRHDSGADSPDGSPANNINNQLQLHEGGDEGVDAKRPRACEACRGLKVRCEPDPNDESQPCKRCRKAGRNCVVTVPTRKRQKKTDSRVAELEKKIDALTASLQSRAAPLAGGSMSTPSPGAGAAGAHNTNKVTIDEPALNVVWRNMPAWPNAGAAEMAEKRASLAGMPLAASGMKRKYDQGIDNENPHDAQDRQTLESLPLDPASIFARLAQGDIVDRGLLTVERAVDLFERYNDHMIYHLPGVVFPPGTTVMELRKSKPTLFLAVMAAASAESPALQKVLQKELMTIFAEKVIMTGEKTVELIQALQVAVIWYWPPEHFEELKFYQLVHIAAVMAIDIGLGQKTQQRRGKFMPEGWRIPTFKRSPLPDPTTIESRRAWLTCYFLTANTSMALHRPNLVRWNPFMSECVEILETSPDAAPTDKYFCHLVWTHRLAEEIGIQFSLDDPLNVVNITDVRTQYALRGLERDLDKYRAAVPPDLLQPTLKISFHVLNLYMHEMALHSRQANTESVRPPFAPDALRDGFSGVSAEPLSAAHISALSACMASINGILTTFISMDIFSVRCLPVFNFVRVAYALVILIKLYFSCAPAGSELGRVINKDEMQVEHYLDALLEKFRATAADDRCRPAAKFLVVLVMLRSWFYKQNSSKADPRSGPGAASQLTPGSAGQTPAPPLPHGLPPQLPPSTVGPSDHQANTPLQLLSEVATGSSSANTPSVAVPSAADAAASSAGTTTYGSWHQRGPAQPFFSEPTPGPNDTPPSATLSGNTGTLETGPPQPDMLAAAMGSGTMVPPGMLGGTQPGLGAFGDLNNFGLDSIDLEGLGLGLDSQEAYENGVRIVMNEPWFDMFQTMPGSGNVFNF